MRVQNILLLEHGSCAAQQGEVEKDEEEEKDVVLTEKVQLLAAGGTNMVYKVCLYHVHLTLRHHFHWFD
jgi:hypothetical protein